MFEKAALIFTAVASLTIANTAHAWIGGYHFDYSDTARYGKWKVYGGATGKINTCAVST